MKFIHLSDLHIGKRLREFSLLDDQKYILLKILGVIDDEKPDAVLIAGDVYDKGIPSEKAVSLFDDFLTRLAKKKIPVFVISGNHDSVERMSFGSKLMEESRVYISKAPQEHITPYELKDEWGSVFVYLLPHINPSDKSFTEAVRTAIQNMNVDVSKRNILVSHQLALGAERSESEDLFIGGSENVELDVFDPFDYVALGHIHKPQKCGRETIRYCGTPLKYSFSEVNHKKSVTVVEFKEKDDINIRTVPLEPMRDLRVIKGKYDDIVLKDFYEKQKRDDYLKIVLTDENDIEDGFARLQTIYPNLVLLDYDNTRTRSVSGIEDLEKIQKTDPLELFMDFYKTQNNKTMTDEQIDFVKELILDVWRDEK